ncbi:MAG: Por secretion system protein, partial [Bacteroidaceae bacterium]|nr:Por secretion system protein [Bacteroidaceae bacterium]
MKKIIFSIYWIVCLCTIQAIPIGNWKTFLSYHDAQKSVIADNLIYVLSSNSLYSYNTADSSIRTYDKVSLLSDCDIQHIDYCTA